ncbi:MAG: hypothetical protein KJ607_09865, partial [Bacteroidetes bacterium]|nr:hypothetical protein [Bacteroidota bacterium]
VKAYSNLAKIYWNKKQDSMVLATIHRSMECAPDRDMPYLNMATYHLMQGDSATAARYFETAIDKEPVNQPVCEYLLRYYQKLGDRQKTAYYSEKLRQAKEEISKWK